MAYRQPGFQQPRWIQRWAETDFRPITICFPVRAYRASNSSRNLLLTHLSRLKVLCLTPVKRSNRTVRPLRPCPPGPTGKISTSMWRLNSGARRMCR
jgi:hypothetical protein